MRDTPSLGRLNGSRKDDTKDASGVENIGKCDEITYDGDALAGDESAGNGQLRCLVDGERANGNQEHPKAQQVFPRLESTFAMLFQRLTSDAKRGRGYGLQPRPTDRLTTGAAETKSAFFYALKRLVDVVEVPPFT